MVKGIAKINDPVGLHLRPAKDLSNMALAFKCKAELRRGNTTANIKSIISLLGACVKSGEEVEIICDGRDEEEALKAIMEILDRM